MPDVNVKIRSDNNAFPFCYLCIFSGQFGNNANADLSCRVCFSMIYILPHIVSFLVDFSPACLNVGNTLELSFKILNKSYKFVSKL